MKGRAVGSGSYPSHFYHWDPSDGRIGRHVNLVENVRGGRNIHIEY